MNNQNDKFGIIVSVAVTAAILGIVGGISANNDGSIQPQGQDVLERTTSEIQNVPDTMQDIASNQMERTENIVSEAPEIIEEIVEESDSIPELVDNTSDVVEDVIPDVPPVVKQSEGKLLELVSIPQDTGTPGCEESDSCYVPAHVMMSPGGEVIWTNHDSVPHTVTSGNPSEGPDGL